MSTSRRGRGVKDDRVTFAQPFLSDKSVAYLLNLYFELRQRKEGAVERAEYEAALAFQRLAEATLRTLREYCDVLGTFRARRSPPTGPGPSA